MVPDTERGSLDECGSLDAADPLAPIVAQFASGEPGVLYFDANSIGAMPRAAERSLERLAAEWRRLRKRGWTDSDWIDAPARLGDKLAPVIGAEPGSVVVCDSTSVNIYKAVRLALGLSRRKIVLAEEGAFPTDLYVAEAAARDGNGFFEKTSSLEKAIGEKTAVVLVTHTDYRSGYRHDLAALTRLAHEHGALTVWDVSHSAGAVEVGLGAGKADFGVGCGYKYLCGGPGAPAWLYVAPRHQGAVAPVIPGWMGHADPMAFAPAYVPAAGAKRHLAGTPGVAGNMLMEAALDLWRDIDPQAAFAKHAALSEFLIRIILADSKTGLTLASPRDPAQRGGFVAFRHSKAKDFVKGLEQRGAIASYRSPDIVRFGLSPLYHRHADIAALGERLRQPETERIE